MKRKYLIGERYINNKGLEYEIIDYVEGSDIYRIVEFIKSGYITRCNITHIKNGAVKDKLAPSVCGVGIMDVPNGSKHILYRRWCNMLKRCYDSNYEEYDTYGAKGVYVCEEWHKFSNYIKDIEKKENYAKLLEKSKEWCIDKDTLTQNEKCYSNDTTIIIHISQNSKEMINRYCRKKPVNQYTRLGKFIRSYDSISDAQKETGVWETDIGQCCKGNARSAGGFIWKYKEV